VGRNNPLKDMRGLKAFHIREKAEGGIFPLGEKGERKAQRGVSSVERGTHLGGCLVPAWRWNTEIKGGKNCYR